MSNIGRQTRGLVFFHYVMCLNVYAVLFAGTALGTMKLLEVPGKTLFPSNGIVEKIMDLIMIIMINHTHLVENES